MDAALHVAGMLEEGQMLWELPEARQRELEAEFEQRRRDYELRQMVLTNSGECSHTRPQREWNSAACPCSQ